MRQACSALLCSTVQPLRRDVGGVGFQHQGIVRQPHGQAADLQRPLVCQGPAKPELEASTCEFLRLHLAAIEGVGDAAGHRQAAQTGQQGVGRAPYVQQYRQAGLPRQLQLRQVEGLLPLAVQPRNEVVQTDLAHRHQTGVVGMGLQGLRQELQVGVGRAVGVEGVNAQRIGQSVAVCQGPHPLEVRSLHGRQHQHGHLHGARAFNHRIAVGVKLGRIQVAVRVHPHARHDARSVVHVLWCTFAAPVLPFSVTIAGRALETQDTALQCISPCRSPRRCSGRRPGQCEPVRADRSLVPEAGRIGAGRRHSHPQAPCICAARAPWPCGGAPTLGRPAPRAAVGPGRGVDGHLGPAAGPRVDATAPRSDPG